MLSFDVGKGLNKEHGFALLLWVGFSVLGLGLQLML